MTSMYDTTSEIKRQALFEEFEGILGFVQTAFRQGGTAYDVEKGLWERMRKLGHSLYGAWLELFGDGDAGDRIVLADGREVPRLVALHRREIQNVFGLFELQRAVYAAREGQKIVAVPLDERLGLPQDKHSYLLQDWEQYLAVEVPYATESQGPGPDPRLHPIGAHPGTSPARAGRGGRGVLGRAPDPTRRGGRGTVGVLGRRQGGADARRRQGTQGGPAPIK